MHLRCAAPQAILRTSLQDIAGDADEELDQGLPFSGGHSLGRAEYRDRPGLMSVSRDGDLGVSADGLLRAADGFGIQQRRLIFLQLDEEASLGLRSGLELFLAVHGIERDECCARG